MDFSGSCSNARIERVPRDTLGNVAMSEVLEFYGGDTSNKPEHEESEGCQIKGRFDEGIEVSNLGIIS